MLKAHDMMVSQSNPVKPPLGNLSRYYEYVKNCLDVPGYEGLGGTKLITCANTLHSQQSTKDNQAQFAEVEIFH